VLVQPLAHALAPPKEKITSPNRIAVLGGSVRKESFNKKLADAIAKLAPPEFSFTQVQVGDLPLYNKDDDANWTDVVKRVKDEIAGAKGLLFVTAEYDRSIPGVYKNAIDHASRPYGQSAWSGKPAGVIGVSKGLPEPPWRNSICGMSWPFWMCPRSGSRKALSMPRKGRSMRLAISVSTASGFWSAGWIDMSRG
jgi:hypothetical protein